MARRRKKGPSKLGAVRELLATNPNMMPTEIVAALKEKGLEISVPQASTYKSAIKRGTGPKKAATAAARNGMPPLVLQANNLVAQLGKEHAKALIDSM